ncbi:lactonase family protein [Mesobacillus boroniphilus]|uniref:Lactonase family protein n=1 Tax=Mesobacillus boroniphilus TaxID=308892 RepID=A0A944CMU7_9BACI|nr:lactonase family protein [Mesobacillus boroniphilus]MBS8266099.1 lactonase family protein [Mesobacillus boroniphilus]
MAANEKFTGYFGTYTKGDSEGIYSFTLDAANGKIVEVKAEAALENPTYLTISEDNRFLYAVAKEGGSGGVAGFSIKDSGELSFINTQLSAGASPCHVSVNRENNLLLSANYHKGSADSYLLNPENGSIEAVLSSAVHEGSGPDERQEKAHTHYAGFTPDGKYVAVIDLGTDQLITYSLDNGQLIEKSVLRVTPGSGPRHLVFHPNNNIAYLMTEFSSEVLVYRYHSEDGRFEHLQAVSTLPADFTENNQGSAIHISSDGKFVYAANRGHDSIAIFQVDSESFKLSYVGHTSTEGNWPRDFVLDPSEEFLIATNQNSSNVVLFSRNEETGKLTLLQSDVKVPDPVCVKFLNY